MKELIESLNLPKQIIDKTEKFMSKLFGSAITEYGELFADKIRFKRYKNQIKILNSAREILQENNLEPRELNLKTLIPLLEKSSIEEDESLQMKWANLISSIASSPETGLEPRLVDTLSSLSSLEAKVIDFIYDEFFVERQLKLARLMKNKWNNKKYKESDIKLNEVTIKFKSVQEQFNLPDEFTKIYMDNLESLGLIKYEEPTIEIDNGSTSADLIDDEDTGQSVDLDLQISADYYGSEDFHLTAFGNYFVEQCKEK